MSHPMTRSELIALLQNQENVLRSLPVQDFIRSQSETSKQKFVALRGQLSGLIDHLEINELRVIAYQLALLEPDIQEGINDLTRTLNRLESAIEITNTLSRVLQLVTRVVALA